MEIFGKDGLILGGVLVLLFVAGFVYLHEKPSGPSLPPITPPMVPPSGGSPPVVTPPPEPPIQMPDFIPTIDWGSFDLPQFFDFGSGIGPDQGDFITHSSDKVVKVWAIDDGERVKQDAINHPLATDFAKNKVWDGHTIRTFGAKNEVVAFQIMLQGAPTGTQDVSVEFPSLTNGGYTIQNSPSSNGDPYNYVGKRIELFKEYYHSIDRRTSVSFRSWSGAMAQPTSDFIGMLPDALIPFESVKGGAPFAIAPNKLQGVWVDIYIPKEASSGVYTGKIKVKAGNQVTHEIPVTLQVYNFALPDETHLVSWWNIAGKGDNVGSGITGKHPVTYGSDAYKVIEGRYFQMAHRHRMDLTINAPVYQDNYTTAGMTIADHFKRYIQGTYFTSAFGYDGPGAGTKPAAWAACIFDFSYWTNNSGKTCGFYPNTQARWWAASDEWVNWFNQNAPGVRLVHYVMEEPYTLSIDRNNLDTMAPTIQVMQWSKANPGPGRNMELMIGGWLEPRFFGLADSWVLAAQTCYPVDKARYLASLFSANRSGYCLPDVKAAKARGEKTGLYMDMRPNWGMVQAIDTQAIDPRVTPWVMWKYDVNHYYQWVVAQWRKNSNAKRDVYADVYSYFDTGDGFFFYPGQQKDYAGGANDFGLQGPISNIRMKNWRRGEQDYEYLWLAKQRGMNTSSIVNAVVPRSFDDYGGTYTSQSSQPTWYQRGYQYENARRQLAEILGK